MYSQLVPNSVALLPILPIMPDCMDCLQWL